MSSARQSDTHRQVQLPARAAASLVTLILAFPLIFILQLAEEPVSPAPVAAVLGLFYIGLFAIYRTLARVASIRTVVAKDDDWIFVISGVAGSVAGVIWLIWAFGMHRPMTTLATYAPLLVGTAFLWAALAVGAVAQRRLTRSEARRVPI